MKNFAVLAFVALLALSHSAAAFEVEGISLPGFELVGLPNVDEAKRALIDEMPKPQDVEFDPISINLYPGILENFREHSIESYNKELKEYCDFVTNYDAKVRFKLIPEEISWKQYDDVLKDFFAKQQKLCSLDNAASKYTSIYKSAQEQLKLYLGQVPEMRSVCNNSPSCQIE